MAAPNFNSQAANQTAPAGPTSQTGLHALKTRVRQTTLGVVLFWLVLVAGLGAWISQRITATWVDNLAASTQYEAETSARVMDRLFTQMSSVANMVARQAQVIQLASRYRTDPPGTDALTRAQRAEQFSSDPLVRKVGDFMNALSSDMFYARIYMNNLSDDTVTSSNWAASDSIVGMIYTNRSYLTQALITGQGHSFGIARLNKTLSYFVSSRIDGDNDEPLGSVTVKFDSPDVARYLTGRHIALIVNRQGRVTTASAAPFMLRNVAALLPPATVRPPEDGEELGEPLQIQAIPGHHAGQWRIEGTPYLVQQQPLVNTQYQLLTLASLAERASMRRQHLVLALALALLGVALILLSGNAIGHLLARRQKERQAAQRKSALNVNLSAALSDAKTKERQKVEVLGYIGHDLRAPLATIRGYSDMLLADAPTAQHPVLQTIQRSVKYQLDLIDELLEYTKSELQPLAVKPGATDLHPLLNEIAEYAVALCGQQNNRFRYHAPERLPRLVALDRKRLQQVLLNLVSNAAKFTRDGEVTLSVTARPEHGAQGPVCALDVAVSDTGIGIDLSQDVDIFGAFQQVQTASGGTGLGLFIAQRILTAMGSTLRVASATGQGTVFSFTLQAPVIGADRTDSADWPRIPPQQTGADAAPANPAWPRHALPDRAALDELAQLAQQGRLSDIEAWLERHDSAAHAHFTAALRERLEQFDFSGLHALALRAKAME